MKRKQAKATALRRPRGDYRHIMLTIPAGVRHAMQRLVGVNWSEVATNAFAEFLRTNGLVVGTRINSKA